MLAIALATGSAFGQTGATTLEGNNDTANSGAGVWSPNVPIFGGTSTQRWNIGNNTADTTFDYLGGDTTIQLDGSGQNRGIVIGNTNLTGSTATFNLSGGNLTVIEASGSGNSAIAVGTPNNNGEHSGVLNIDGGNLIIDGNDGFGELTINFRGGAAQTGTVNLAAGSNLTVDEIEHIHDGQTGNANGATGTFNWNGNWTGSRLRNNDSGATNPSVFNVNVDGGTWTVRDETQNFISSTLDSFELMAGGWTINADSANVATLDTAINAAMTGIGGLTKTGDARVSIGFGAASASTYTGDTNVLGGELILDNGSSLTSNVFVDAVAGFGGDGAITGDLDLDGTYMLMNLGDLLAVSGSLDLTGSTLDLSNVVSDGNDFTFATFGTLTSDFGAVDFGASGYTGITYDGGAITLVAIPEPATMTLFVLGSVAMLGRRRRRA